MSDETDLPPHAAGESDVTPPSTQAPQGDVPPSQPQPMTLPLRPSAVPPGYVLPLPGTLPPPGYPPPFAGNVPPGAVPPGYPPLPPYFIPVEFPPPPAYAVPPRYPGYPWEIVAPAQGNLLQAWFAIATNLSRRTIAARAQGMQQNWAAWSIGVGVILVTLAGTLNGVRLLEYRYPANLMTSNPQGAQSLQMLQNIVKGEGIATPIITPLFLLMNVFLLPWFWSFFMTPLLGSPRQRFQRAFRPLALIQPVVGALALVEAILAFALNMYAPAVVVLASIISIPLMVYTIALNIQTGAVGSGLKRWPVFGIQLLAGVAVGFVFAIIAIVALVIFIVTQAQ